MVPTLGMFRMYLNDTAKCKLEVVKQFVSGFREERV